MIMKKNLNKLTAKPLVGVDLVLIKNVKLKCCGF